MEYTERLIFREEVLRRANGLLPSDCASFETDDNQFVLQYLKNEARADASHVLSRS